MSVNSFVFPLQEPGYVGFANLPNQVHRKSVKKVFEFTLMVVGKCHVFEFNLLLDVCSKGFLFRPFYAVLLLVLESQKVISYDEKVSAIKVLTCIKGILHISRKYPYPPQGKLLKILKGRGASKANIFKRLFEAKLEFPEGCELRL